MLKGKHSFFPVSKIEKVLLQGTQRTSFLFYMYKINVKLLMNNFQVSLVQVTVSLHLLDIIYYLFMNNLPTYLLFF